MNTAVQWPAAQKSARLRNWLKEAAGPLAAASLAVAAQSFEGWGWLSLIALVPILPALKARSFPATCFRLGLFSAVHYIAGLHWAPRSGPGFGWILIAIGLASQGFALVTATILWSAGTRHGWRRLLLAAPAAFMAPELLQRLSLLRLNWLLFGAPLADYPALAQVASIVGPEALTYIAVASNTAIAALICRDSTLKLWRIGLQGFGPLAGCMFWGFWSLWWVAAPAGTLRIAVVQPVASQRIGWVPKNRGPLLSLIGHMVHSAAAHRPDLIVLPEGMLRGPLRFDPALQQFVSSQVARTGIPLLFGSTDYDPGTRRLFNAAIMQTPGGAVTVYRKSRPVPVTEVSIRPLGLRRAGNFPEFSAGQERTIFALPRGPRFSTVICVEDTMPELAREFALKGAGALIAIINTEYFSGTAQPVQHLRRARLTAISAGIPVIRAANSGISCAIDNRGRILDRLPEGKRTTGLFEVRLSCTCQTVYARFGDLPAALTLALVVALLLFRGGSEQRRRHALMKPRFQSATAIE